MILFRLQLHLVRLVNYSWQGCCYSNKALFINNIGLVATQLVFSQSHGSYQFNASISLCGGCAMAWGETLLWIEQHRASIFGHIFRYKSLANRKEDLLHDATILAYNYKCSHKDLASFESFFWTEFRYYLWRENESVEKHVLVGDEDSFVSLSGCSKTPDDVLGYMTDQQRAEVGLAGLLPLLSKSEKNAVILAADAGPSSKGRHTLNEIALLTGKSRDCVRTFLKRAGIKAKKNLANWGDLHEVAA